MTTLIIMALVGLGLFSLGLWSIRTRAHDDRISVIEAAILKTTGEQPLPLTAGDRAWGRAQTWAMIILGGFLFALGGLIIVISLFELE